jgi:group I intron endonuclease
MIKRVTSGKEISGIYKITRLSTGEIYIGKSTNIVNRWRQHTKSCYHCGTISHSMLHTTMEKDGIENFTWEILEEVPKAQLSEREAYWIKFYDSKNYGLNEREG